MADSNISQRAGFPNELSAVMTGSQVKIGTLTHAPAILIFDNQGTVNVAIGIDGVNTWRTFTAGETLILDLRCQQGKAANFTVDIGTSFYGNGASGTFSISYIYAL